MKISSPKFDPKSINFSFAAISDLHIKDEPDQYNRQKLVSALKQLEQKAAQDCAGGLAAVVVAGDLTQDGNENEIIALRQTLEGAMDLKKTAFIYVSGNHDKHNPDCNSAFDAVLSPVAGAAYDSCELSPDGIWGGSKHITVGGRHFILLSIDKYHKKHPNKFSEPTKRWLDETLHRITEREPNAYVFVVTHLLINDTCYGSTRSVFHSTDDISEILSKYPQAVTFGGHLHYPLNDERAIMQTKFTSMETATLSNMLIDGHGLANVIKNTKTEGNTEFAQGLLVQIDTKNNIRVTRMDFYHQTTIDEPWYLDAPTADGAHLTRYTAARAQAFEPSAMQVGKKIQLDCKADENGDGFVVTVNFETAKYDHPIRMYAVRVTNAETGDLVTEAGYLTKFYRHPDFRSAETEMTVTLPTLFKGSYKISVAARDCWGNEGAALNTELEIN